MSHFSAPTLKDYNLYDGTEYLKYQTNTKYPNFARVHLHVHANVSVAAVYGTYMYKAVPGRDKM